MANTMGRRKRDTSIDCPYGHRSGEQQGGSVTFDGRFDHAAQAALNRAGAMRSARQRGGELGAGVAEPLEGPQGHGPLGTARPVPGVVPGRKGVTEGAIDVDDVVGTGIEWQSERRATGRAWHVLEAGDADLAVAAVTASCHVEGQHVVEARLCHVDLVVHEQSLVRGPPDAATTHPTVRAGVLRSPIPGAGGLSNSGPARCRGMSEPAPAKVRPVSWMFVGLDGEMSAGGSTGSRLIQAGAAAWTDGPGSTVAVFSSLIAVDPGVPMTWSPRAGKIHGITPDALENAAAAGDVDDALTAWLVAHGANLNARSVVPIGFNVAAFDLPHFRRTLPHTASLLSRRSIDLNAVCFTFSGWSPAEDAARTFTDWRRALKEAANAVLATQGIPTAEHDAGFDAAQALVGWYWLRSQLTGAPLR